ncbi:hypothetical protein HID58_086729 [Brassica napus]|uniref:Uncharacterized protein n=1 Tax=Brassica napus TaxID=3708 RepID=A0ABQ7XRE8_BRANA|nr:hypothetical protein HID58_086729 [Brassica napus]
MMPPRIALALKINCVWMAGFEHAGQREIPVTSRFAIHLCSSERAPHLLHRDRQTSLVRLISERINRDRDLIRASSKQRPRRRLRSNIDLSTGCPPSSSDESSSNKPEANLTYLVNTTKRKETKPYKGAKGPEAGNNEAVRASTFRELSRRHRAEEASTTQKL